MSDGDRVPWYERWFNSEYLRVYAHRDVDEAHRQIDLVERCLRPARGARVLDLCCGGGRHSVELARRGYRVTGVDLSEPLLNEARRMTAEADLFAEFNRCDMREVVSPGAFDLVVNFFTSFGYFDRDEENARVLGSIRAHLRTGGNWFMDYLNRDNIIQTLVPHDERVTGDIHLIQERHVDLTRGRIDKTLTLRHTDGSVSMHTESVRMYSLPELTGMLECAGLRITHTFGDTDGTPFSVSSPRLVLAGTTAEVSPS
jgi:SAM-dependent methyltransferase